MELLNNFLAKEYHRLDLWYFVSFISSIAYYFTFLPNLGFTILFFCVVLSIILINIFYKVLFLRFLLFIFVFFALGALVSKYRMQSFKPILLVEAVIVDIQGAIKEMKPTHKGSQIVVEVHNINKMNQLKNSKVRINISQKTALNLHAGDKIYVIAKLFNLSRRLLPNAYDFGFYLYLKVINASGYAINEPIVLETKKRSYVQSIRQKIYSRLITKAGFNTGNFLAAILLGESKAIDKNLLQSIRLAGISHILCVSGLHLSLVAMLTFGFTRFLLNISNYIAFNINIKIIASLVSSILSFAYLVLTGVQIAASRAFIMTLIFIISIMIDRKSHLLRTLGIAVIIVIAGNPEYIFYPAFQLSFIAVLSLISGYEFYKNHNSIFGNSYGILGQVKFYLISNIYSSFLASIVTAPVIISQFYLISTYCLLNNLIAVPIMSFALMPLGLVTLLAMPFGLDGYFIKCASIFINMLIEYTKYSNSLKFSVWYFGHITKLDLCIFLFGFFGFAYGKQKSA